MTSNVNVCTPPEIYKTVTLRMAWIGRNTQKHCLIFKNVVVNPYANHALSIFNCMPQHYIHTMYCYKTFHYKRYKKYKYILFISMLPYRIPPKHVMTLTVKYSNIENETVCKFRSNINDVCILKTTRICFKTT